MKLHIRFTKEGVEELGYTTGDYENVATVALSNGFVFVRFYEDDKAVVFKDSYVATYSTTKEERWPK